MSMYRFVLVMCFISLLTACPRFKRWWKHSTCPSKTLPRGEAYNSFNASNKFVCTVRSNGVDCMSVSFDVVTKTCYQFDKIGDDVGCSDMVDEPNTIYYYKDIECFNGGVQNTSTSCICTELTYGVNCGSFKARCEMDPYVVDHAVLMMPITGRNVSLEGDLITYNCSIGGYQPFSTCQSNGTWSRPSQCLPASCKDIKICSSSYTSDGEYWLYPPAVAHKPVKVYCHGMSTTNPTDFITLYGNNVAYYPNKEQSSSSSCTPFAKNKPNSGTTRFTKVRIISSMLQVIDDDYTFASTTNAGGYYILFGNAMACSLYNPCPGLGTMVIDITNTGLVFSDQISWKPSGWASKIDHVTRINNQVIEGRCDGYCGGCMPVSPITFELDSSYVHNWSEATVVSCGAT